MSIRDDVEFTVRLETYAMSIYFHTKEETSPRKKEHSTKEALIELIDYIDKYVEEKVLDKYLDMVQD